jgi:hypothetical protein
METIMVTADWAASVAILLSAWQRASTVGPIVARAGAAFRRHTAPTLLPTPRHLAPQRTKRQPGRPPRAAR